MVTRIYVKRSFEDCVSLASKYSDMQSWRKAQQREYTFARNKGWCPAIAKSLNWTWEPKIYVNRSFSDCLQIAQQYTSLTEWATKDPASYLCATRHKWSQKIANKLKWKVLRKRWSYEECLKLASRFKRINQWRKHSDSSYQCAYNKGWLDLIIKELNWTVKRRSHKTYEQCLEDARRFRSVGQWQLGSKAYYGYAYVRGWHNKIAETLNWGKKTRLTCLSE